MSFHNKTRHILTNEEIEKKAQELRNKFSEDYTSISHIYRAGVVSLWNEKIRGKK